MLGRVFQQGLPIRARGPRGTRIGRCDRKQVARGGNGLDGTMAQAINMREPQS